VFELPEVVTLAAQINETLTGKAVQSGSLGNRPHKFVWYNRSHEEFARLTAGRRVGPAHGRGKLLFVALEPGYVLLFGECGGKMLYHPSEARTPDGYHLRLDFDDHSALTVTTAMWGAMELHEAGREQERPYISGMRPTPVEPGFTFDCFSALIDDPSVGGKYSAKGLLTRDQLIPGLGNGIAQDILWRARLAPRHPLAALDTDQRPALHAAIVGTIREAIALGGRNDEVDLFGNAGRYVRVMGRDAAGRPCPACGTIIRRIQYLGGACFFCPACQV